MKKIVLMERPQKHKRQPQILSKHDGRAQPVSKKRQPTSAKIRKRPAHTRSFVQYYTAMAHSNLFLILGKSWV